MAPWIQPFCEGPTMTHPAHSVPAVVDSANEALGSAAVAARPKFDRRLAAVLIADVAGYSRLMEQDETGTHVRLQVLRAEVIEPALARHAGRITRSTGDGLLVTFASATEALRCAVEIQREMADRNAQIAQQEQIAFRMGLNVGDVLFDQHDIAGVSVNLAARLEALARPGEICISRAFKEHVQENLGVRYLDAGSKRVKNISQPVRVYRVLAVPLATQAALQTGLGGLLGSVSRWIAAGSAAVAIAVFSTALPTRLAAKPAQLQNTGAISPAHVAVQTLDLAHPTDALNRPHGS
jgi:adenylate cyclase